MAKTMKIKKADNYTFEITSKTKDTTYVFANATEAGASSLNFNNNGGSNPTYIKDGNDLLIFITFGNYTNCKLSVTRIKDYYLYCGTNNGLVRLNDASIYANANSNAYSYVKKEFTDSSSAENVFSDAGATIYNISNSKDKTYILDATGSDKYFVNGLLPTSAPVYVDDMAGNDYYEITNSRGIQINDFKGNDKYVVKNCNQIISSNDATDDSLKTDIWIVDYSGNDSYTFDNVIVTNGVECKQIDVTGNDKYTLNNTTYMYLEDDAGNDKYTANQSHHFRIQDGSGNDSYMVTKSDYVTITDEENDARTKGNDKYTANLCTNVTIEDSKGADKYAFDGSEIITINDYNYQNDGYTVSHAANVNINDRGGKETYKLSHVSGATIIDSSADGVIDNDSMIVSDSININITNKHGNVKYTFTNTSGITIEDKTGKDTYTISGLYNKKTKATTFAENVTITDMAQHEENHNDTFNFTYVKGSSNPWATYLASDNWTITEYGGSNTYNIKQSENIKIHSNNGNCKDTYNITSCKNVYLLDKGSNNADAGSSDIYNVKFAENAAVTICDNGGANDKLTISGVSKKNIVLMSNYKRSGASASDEQESLIIFDTKSKSYVQIQDFYHDSGSGEYSNNLFGNGTIETIKAGGTVNATNADMIANLNSIRLQMTAFLNNGESVVDVLNSGNDNRIQDLVTLYSYQA